MQPDVVGWFVIQVMTNKLARKMPFARQLAEHFASKPGLLNQLSKEIFAKLDAELPSSSQTPAATVSTKALSTSSASVQPSLSSTAAPVGGQARFKLFAIALILHYETDIAGKHCEKWQSAGTSASYSTPAERFQQP